MRKFVKSTFIALTLLAIGLMLVGCGSGGGSGGGTSSQVLNDNNSAGATVAGQVGGVSPAASAGTATPGAPVTSVGKQLTLAWDPVAGATSYNLYWSTAPGVTSASGTKISAVSSSYVHTGLAAGTTYYYVVTAVDSTSESAASISASGTTAL